MAILVIHFMTDARSDSRKLLDRTALAYFYVVFETETVHKRKIYNFCAVRRWFNSNA